MNILISGSSGLIGSHLVPFLQEQQYGVSRLVRSHDVTSANIFYWNPEQNVCPHEVLEKQDIVIHLCGNDIVSQRWNSKHKKNIIATRLQSTQLLCNTLAALEKPPQALLVASSAAYYGSCGGQELDESSVNGKTFLARVCQEWEKATLIAQEKGIRVVNLRFGPVLSNKGGALVHLLKPFKLGLGGKVGNGRQYISWIAIDDALAIITHVLKKPSISGPINVTAPNPVTNQEFVEALGTILGCSTSYSMPAFTVKLSLGEMANEVVLAGTKAVPKKLIDSKYEFIYPCLMPALKNICPEGKIK